LLCESDGTLADINETLQEFIDDLLQPSIERLGPGIDFETLQEGVDTLK